MSSRSVVVPPADGSLRGAGTRAEMAWVLPRAASLVVLLLLVGQVAAHEGEHAVIHETGRRLAADPDDGALHLRRAEAHRRSAHWDQAACDLARAEALGADPRAVVLARARLARDRGHLDLALAWYDACLVGQPDHPRALRERAQVVAARGDLPGAARAWTRALVRLDPVLPDDYLARADVMAALPDVTLERLVAGLDEGLIRLGPQPALQLRAVEADQARGAFDTALGRLDVLARLSVRQERWLARRGSILAAAGRPAAARSAYQDAMSAIEGLRLRHRTSAATVALRKEVELGLRRLEGDSTPRSSSWAVDTTPPAEDSTP